MNSQVFNFGLLLILQFVKLNNCVSPSELLFGTADYTYCTLPFTECCSPRRIPARLNDLEINIRKNVYGQHLLLERLIPALKAHYNSEAKARKALVISFHGTPGTGKNFVTEHIANHLYANGIKSRFVHKFGKSDFPLESKVDEYKQTISQKIQSEVYKCDRSLFIFDEVDSLPPGLFEAITTFLDFHDNINGVDYTQSVFLFLSNTAGKEISHRLYERMSSGYQRTDTKLNDFEDILEAGTYSLINGLQGGRILRAHLIDYFLPFLPLEKQHVRECILSEYKRWNIFPSEQSVSNILTNEITYDPDYQLFSVAGCKRIDGRVREDVMKNYKNEL